MSLTYPTVYSKLTAGLLKGRMDLLNKFNTAFTIPGSAGAGVINVHMLDTIVSETPSAGTFLAQGVANTLTALTLGHKFVTNLMSVNNMDSVVQDPAGMEVLAEAYADQLAQDMQAVIVAGLKAASITTNTYMLKNTYIDFAVPGSTTTTASLIIQMLAPFNRMIVKVLAASVGRPLSDFYILMPTTAFANLMALYMDFPGPVPIAMTAGGQDNKFQYRGIDIFAVDGTNFGGATYEVAFAGHKSGYAFKFDGIRPWRGGVPVEDGDGQIRQSYYARYASGLIKEAKLGQLINSSS